MRLTKEDGEILLGAIRTELDSQQWREQARAKYLDSEQERGVKAYDEKRNADLRRVRDKIKAQIKR